LGYLPLKNKIRETFLFSSGPCHHESTPDNHFPNLRRLCKTAERLDQVRAPAGLDLGAETQGEIALSVLAEMLAVRRQATAMPMVTFPGKHGQGQTHHTAGETKSAQ